MLRSTLLCPVLSDRLSHTHPGEKGSDSCYLSSRGEVWSADNWNSTSISVVEEALIEAIRGDGWIGAGRSTRLASSQSVDKGNTSEFVQRAVTRLQLLCFHISAQCLCLREAQMAHSIICVPKFCSFSVLKHHVQIWRSKWKTWIFFFFFVWVDIQSCDGKVTPSIFFSSGSEFSSAASRKLSAYLTSITLQLAGSKECCSFSKWVMSEVRQRYTHFTVTTSVAWVIQFS